MARGMALHSPPLHSPLYLLSSGQPITPLRGNSAANGAILLAAR